MNKNLNRRQFVTHGCACGALLLAGTSPGMSETTEAKPPKDDLTHRVNPPQVMAVLTDIDRSGDKNPTDAVFTRWGYQCFHTRGDLKAFGHCRVPQRQRAGALQDASRSPGRSACPPGLGLRTRSSSFFSWSSIPN